MAKKRKKMSYSKSKRDFTAKSGTHPINVKPRPQRGGISM